MERDEEDGLGKLVPIFLFFLLSFCFHRGVFTLAHGLDRTVLQYGEY